MTEIKDTCYKGTRILLGNEKRDLVNNMISLLKSQGFIEISIPVIQYQEYFSGKVGEENNNIMFNFTDRAERKLCLAPEYTAIVQKLANTRFKQEKNLKLFYVQECFRGEKPQAGRYRQFTQLGIEILNPTEDYYNYLISLATTLIAQNISGCDANWYSKVYLQNLIVDKDATRGLDYYKDGKGFEITYEQLGAQKQICGGGSYDGGIGFAIGIDRLLLINKNQ